MYEPSWRDLARDAQKYPPTHPLWDLPGPRTLDAAYVLERRRPYNEFRVAFDRTRGCWLASFNDMSGCLYVAEGRGITEAQYHVLEALACAPPASAFPA